MDELGVIVLIVGAGVILSRVSRIIGRRLFNTSRFFERHNKEEQDDTRQ